MKEEKKSKKTTAKNVTKKNTTKKEVYNGKNTVKNSKNKTATKSGNKTVKKVNSPKNNNVKKSNTQKTTPKKVKPIKKHYKSSDKEEQLEKTLIFDGKQNENLEKVVNNLEKKNVVVKDKVSKRSKSRKAIVIILSLLIVCVIVGTAIFTFKEIRKDKVDSQTTNSNVYKKVVSKKTETPQREIEKSSYEHIQRLSLKEFEDKVKAKEDMPILISVETCARCVAFEEVAEEVFGELDKTIYEIDITQYTAEEVRIFRTYYSFTQTPTIFYLKDGIVFNDIIPTIEADDLRAWINDVM